MAVSGHTRDKVDAHLREAFRVTETAQLLDDVFGPGSGESRGGLDRPLSRRAGRPGLPR
jgi:hypothetical protein